MKHQMNNRQQPSGCMSILLWPFVALWTLVATIIQLVGRVLAFVIGLVFMIAGALLTVTVIGAVVGIPLAVLGLLLVMRSLF